LKGLKKSTNQKKKGAIRGVESFLLNYHLNEEKSKGRITQNYWLNSKGRIEGEREG